MKWKDILFVLGLSAVLGACEKKDIEVFTTDDAGIYFQLIKGYYGTTTEIYTDSLDYSFASLPASMKDVILPATVRTMGKVADYDRPFKVVVDKEGTTAIEGVHYEIDLDSVVVPAGKSSANVNVRFFRTDDLMEKSVRLALRLEDNEHFKCYFSEYKNMNIYSSTGVLIHGDSFSFTLSEMYTIPWYWRVIIETDYFGVWTPKKFVVINLVCGFTMDDWNNAGGTGAKIIYGRCGFFATMVQKYLQEQADAGTPVVDSDGKYMQLDSDYAVDYSRYE